METYCVSCKKYTGNENLSVRKTSQNRLMPELSLKQPGFASGPFNKHRERIQKFTETGDLKHLYRHELDKSCFAHDAAYSDKKDLAKRTISDKILKNRAFEIAGNRNYDGYQRALASMV